MKNKRSDNAEDLLTEFFIKLFNASYQTNVAVKLSGVSEKQINYWLKVGYISCRSENLKYFSVNEIIKIYMIGHISGSGRSLELAVKIVNSYYEYFFEGKNKPEINDNIFSKLSREKILKKFRSRWVNNLFLSKAAVSELFACSPSTLDLWVKEEIIFLTQVDGWRKGVKNNLFDFFNVFKVFVIKRLSTANLIKKELGQIDEVVETVQTILTGKTKFKETPCSTKVDTLDSNHERFDLFISRLINLPLESFNQPENVDYVKMAYVLSCFCGTLKGAGTVLNKNQILGKIIEFNIKNHFNLERIFISELVNKICPKLVQLTILINYTEIDKKTVSYRLNPKFIPMINNHKQLEETKLLEVVLKVIYSVVVK